MVKMGDRQGAEELDPQAPLARSNTGFARGQIALSWCSDGSVLASKPGQILASAEGQCLARAICIRIAARHLGPTPIRALGFQQNLGSRRNLLLGGAAPTQPE